MTYNELITAIKAAIGPNGNQHITGQVMQDTLLNMVQSLGKTYAFGGVATPSTNPATPEVNTLYLATEAGTYENMGGVVLADGEKAIFAWNGVAWNSYKFTFGIDNSAKTLNIETILGINGDNDTLVDDTFGDGAFEVPAEIKKGDVFLCTATIQGDRSSFILATTVRPSQSPATEHLAQFGVLENETITFVAQASFDAKYIKIYSQGGSATLKVKVERFHNASPAIDTLRSFTNGYAYNVRLSFEQGLLSGGTIVSSSAVWGVSNMLSLSGAASIDVSATSFPGAPYESIAFYGADKEYISGITLTESQKLLVPEGAEFARVSARVSEGFAVSAVKYMEAYRTSVLASESASKVIPKNINYVGMSIWWYDGRTLGAGFMGGELARGYQTLISEQFTFDNINNYVYSGMSLGGLTSADTSSIMNQASSWAKSPNAIWTLDSITNDFKRNIPIGTIDDYNNATGIATYYGALRAFKDRVTALSGDDVIVICSNALHRNNSGYTSTSTNSVGAKLMDYSLALMRVAAIEGWLFVDQFNNTAITDDTVSVTTIDGLHLNNFGYSLAVRPWLEVFAGIKRMLNYW